MTDIFFRPLGGCLRRTVSVTLLLGSAHARFKSLFSPVVPGVAVSLKTFQRL